MCWSGSCSSGSLTRGRPSLATLWPSLTTFRVLATLWTLLALTHLTGVVEGKARYLSHYPLPDDYLTPAVDPDTPDFDADVKLPGRFFPKLPYAKPYLEVNNHNYNHHHRLNPHEHYHHHHHFQQQPQPPPHDTTSHNHHTIDSPIKQRRSSSQAGYGGGYMFGVEEEGGERRFIAVRGSHTPAASYGDARFLEEPQEDATLGPPPGPSFDRNLPRNITIQSGKTAVLSCRVFNVNDKSVSWIRQDDLHILTVDKYKYSTDQRVSVVFNEPNLEWVLRIRGVTPADAGRYECQVSTKPVLSFVVNLKVVVPRAWVLNAPEIFVHRGSPINLTCVVTHGTERPVFIYWYHHNQVIDYEGRGGVTVHTQTGRDTVSHLLVKEAGPGDSGKYTCSPSNGEDASVNLHVLNGEYQAAMQTNTSAGWDCCWTLVVLVAWIHAFFATLRS
ncbi:hypothetical protein OTU49_002025 [Cherax quadricarinatus]|uniref:Ig-like domain-containing protein n=1 Tax=Cherax quadricarinatus TaxID=27406 RepID=A0AAW0XQ85_CHEQU